MITSIRSNVPARSASRACDAKLILTIANHNHANTAEFVTMQLQDIRVNALLATLVKNK
jgi:hypothetical protein